MLELLRAQEQSTSQIARSLVVGPSAVRVHIAAIVRKLEVPDRATVAELFRGRFLTSPGGDVSAGISEHRTGYQSVCRAVGLLP